MSRLLSNIDTRKNNRIDKLKNQRQQIYVHNWWFTEYLGNKNFSFFFLQFF